MALPRLESFSSGAGPLDGTWTQQRSGSFLSYDGLDNCAGDAETDSYAFDNSNSYPADQYSQVVIGSGLASGTDYAGTTTRASLTGDTNYKNYVAYTDGASGAGHTELGVVTADVLTVLRNFAATFTTGDVLRLQSVGSVHEVFKALAATPTVFVSLGTFTDSTHASGSAGLRISTVSGLVKIPDWEGGAVVSAGVPGDDDAYIPFAVSAPPQVVTVFA